MKPVFVSKQSSVYPERVWLTIAGFRILFTVKRESEMNG